MRTRELELTCVSNRCGNAHYAEFNRYVNGTSTRVRWTITTAEYERGMNAVKTNDDANIDAFCESL